ncbi:hypothetical protein Rumeso_00315 [Rubellimicrobium mesophilum DSM 19309]|uniref:DUF4334 domain-containing protein n=1 Tax=Rubellimicrobium mesophilum DSM 19309 TaxID=442562 RepID=A0A017HWH3_9RHOB|nr:GXWXG domain-containing protein [Rubellimicrobium mesophilum]EYD78079.1 hypothetical protein Rumeso_00315 [Rubellimicrobium mesophilum DSM 19309]
MSQREKDGPDIPAWLSDWQARGLSTPEALACIDQLPAPDPEAVIGRWRGRTLPTDHPLDGLLEALGWQGKAVESPERVHPLLFRLPSGQVIPLEPALMPTRVALRWPALARSRPVRAAFAALGPLLRARGPAARLAPRVFRGRSGIALIYDRRPIADHLRRVDAGHVIGIMERKGMARPFFFLLSREAGELSSRPRPPD